MPGWNTTVQDYSPLISYAPIDAWSAGSTSLNPFYDSFNDGYTSTSTINATATFECNGSGVWIYGSKGPNHGAYTVTLDGITNDFNAKSIGGFQTVLFGASGLDVGKHEIQLVNSGGDVVEVDFITCEHPGGEDENLLQQMYIDIGSRQWVYNGDWTMDRNTSSWNNPVIHSSISNATATLQFRGDHIDLYGQMGPTCGSFMVSIDNETDAQSFNCNSSTTHSGVLLYSADMTTRGNHSLKVTNVALSEQSTLYLQNAVVISTVDGSREQSPPSRPLLSKNAMIGTIVSSSVVALVIVFGCIVCCLRRRRRNLRRPELKEVIPDHSKRPDLEGSQINIKPGLQNNRPMVYLALPSPSPSSPSPLTPLSPLQIHAYQAYPRSPIVRARSTPARFVPVDGTGGRPIPGRGTAVPWLVIPEARQMRSQDSPLTPLAPNTPTHHPVGNTPLPPPPLASRELNRAFSRTRDEKRRRDRLSHPPPPNYWQATSQPP